MSVLLDSGDQHIPGWDDHRTEHAETTPQDPTPRAATPIIGGETLLVAKFDEPATKTPGEDSKTKATVASPSTKQCVSMTRFMSLADEDTPAVLKAQRPLRKAASRKEMLVSVNTEDSVPTQYGFTPVASDDEGSSTPRRLRDRHSPETPRSPSVIRKDLNLGNLSGSGTHPSGRSSSPSPGISALSRQIDSESPEREAQRPNLIRTSSCLTSEMGSGNASSTTASDDESIDTTTYEVPLNHEFVSKEVLGQDVPNGERGSRWARKMHATDFQTLRCLGKGTFGTVMLVKQNGSGKLFAQKHFRKASLTVRKKLVEQTKTERVILESINRHPFVVKLYYAFQDHEKLYLILEYAQGGELFERMRNERMFPEATAAFYMAEMVLALDHLHNTVGVVYRDLKPENCLLDADGHLLLTDFGLSKVAAEGDECRSMTGTIEYMAPEVIQEEPYGAVVDWWSFGILGVDLLTGSTPFQAPNDMKIREKIIKAKLALPYYLGPDAKDLLTRLLRKDPRKRLGGNMPKDLGIIQHHRFFRKIDWRKLERRELTPPIQPVITDPELAENFSPEFTQLSIRPSVTESESGPGNGMAVSVPQKPVVEADPFGGFSFVGSSSLLEEGLGCH